MTSPTNTAGLEVVRIVACHLPGSDCPDTACLPVTITAGDLRSVYAALVTAASAQARIAELEADKAMMGGQLEASRSMLDAEKARADRLATLSTRLSARLCEALERAYVTDAEWVKTEYPNGVSEKLVIDAALQDQPK
ncbi:hypothetical protein [Brevundimonas aurantiaca]|uniref:hypothetical protein n=1 Tax=Brevundimonas aurantiaca TaxID=74316 RepID=UPI001D195F71|nr:hypothetical protein [Brevundimonas aurantiaca]MCC4295809.1 hypothetical protein [Brevundimonas aurantiaca]